jgi:hypothetical protein
MTPRSAGYRDRLAAGLGIMSSGRRRPTWPLECVDRRISFRLCNATFAIIDVRDFFDRRLAQAEEKRWTRWRRLRLFDGLLIASWLSPTPHKYGVDDE